LLQAENEEIEAPPHFTASTVVDHLDDDQKVQATAPKDFSTPSAFNTVTFQSSIKPEFHSVDSSPMNSASHTADHSENSHHPASPPPIAALNHSPALSVSSLDRSSGASPPPRQNSLQSAPMYSSFPYTNDSQVRQHSRSHHNSHPSARGNLNTSQGYSLGYSPHGNFDHRYELNPPSDHSSYQMHSAMPGTHVGLPGVQQNRVGYAVPYPVPGQSNNHIIHTDDATTKLSERVRRRCFNCCTTDTSTWRRSNLSPGKVLCNKCGLFERTHSRPRPEQFPHKRGPLASSTLRARNTPSPQPPPPPLPPISTHGHTLPPPHHSHPSIAPLTSVPDSRRPYQSSNMLPEIQSWLHEPPHTGSAPPQTVRKTVAPMSPPARQGTPPLAHMQGSSTATSSSRPSGSTTTFESRDSPSTRESSSA
jgi:hypothetical protein